MYISRELIKGLFIIICIKCIVNEFMKINKKYSYFVTIDAHNEATFSASPMVIKQGRFTDVAHLSDTLDHSLPSDCSVYKSRTCCQGEETIDTQSVKSCERKEINKATSFNCMLTKYKFRNKY